MKIRIVDTEDGFDGLEAVWSELAERTASSFFSSFDYVQTAWHHFHGREDRLFIFVFSEAGATQAIVPFCIVRRRVRGIPCRTIRFIAAWEGDRPRILSVRNEIEIWRALFRFLEKEFTDWEILDLIEQPTEGPTDSGWSFLPQSGWYWEREPDVVDYYITLEGSWEEYLGGLSLNTRRNWRRQARHLSAAPGGYAFERICDPSAVQAALMRFIAIEQSSWKTGRKIGVAKDLRHQRFYEDMVARLAAKQQVIFHFLKIGQSDAAGIFSFMSKDVVYARHTAYLPDYSAYSPGILVLAEIIREGLIKPWREFDLLGMKEDGSSFNYKMHWANGKRKTVHWTGSRLWGRLLPLIAARRFKRLLSRRPSPAAKGAGIQGLNEDISQ